MLKLKNVLIALDEALSLKDFVITSLREQIEKQNEENKQLKEQVEKLTTDVEDLRRW